jgi:RHS repeat-associated protein
VFINEFVLGLRDVRRVDQVAGRDRRRPRRPRRASRRGRQPIFDPLEDRRLMALLGLSNELTKPDVTSGVSSNVSYTQVGNNDNPFNYSAVPLLITLPNGSTARIKNPTNPPAAATQLSLFLDNTGALVNGANGTFAITGKTVINGQTFDGTLLTAQPRGFGYSNSITTADADFDVLLAVTGGLAAGPNGPFKVGDSIGLVIHQPGVKIAAFPASFSSTGQSMGTSDTAEVPQPLARPGNRIPLLPKMRNPLDDVGPSPSTSPSMSTSPTTSGTGATAPKNPVPAVSNLNSTALDEDTGNGTVALYDGSVTMQMTSLEVPGRGMDWALTLTYRSDVQSDGAVGEKWEMNYDRRLEVVDSANLSTFQTAFPSAKIGDVDLIDGDGRDDLYVLNPDGSYTSPSGFYTTLTLHSDGSYLERFSDGSSAAYRAPDSSGIAPMTTMTDRDGDTMRFTYNYQDELTFAYDTLGRPYQYSYNATGLLTSVLDYDGRTTQFGYDASDNLISVTTPSVTGTPTGNNFAGGLTTRYTYNANHELLTVTAPDEVMDSGPPRLSFTYDTSGRVSSLTEGGTNASGVMAGGTINYTYQTLGTPTGPNDTTTTVAQTTATDRNGNVTVYQYNQYNNTVMVDQEANRGVDPGIPSSTGYTTRYTFDSNYRLLQETNPEGNSISYTYDSSNPSRFQQGDILSETITPDAARGGDQSAITTTYTYEPIYNHVHTMTEPRGNDPSYVPQNGGTSSAARYTTTYTYDYQEGTNFSALGALLGISAAAAQARLAADGVPMGLGDVNGDGTTNQISGNLIREQDPTVTLLPGSNEAAVEGTTQQPIVTLYTYNQFGQTTSTTDPEGNVTTYSYYPERDPGHTGIILNPNGNPTTGGYLYQTDQDAVSTPDRDSGANPTPTRIVTTYAYDVVGNQTAVTDGRGIVTQYVYNQLDQVVEVMDADSHVANPSEPLPLVDFQYIERYFYDANGNVVLHQVEDRGDTSNVGYPPPAGSLPSYITNTDPVGGPTYDDTVTRYDILNHPIDSIAEVGGGQFLDTRSRYDPDGNLVLTIQPEGNATATVFDERNQVFRTYQGATGPENPLTLLAPTDPTNYNVRGGIISTESYRYDANGNLIESVDADDTDLSSANNDTTLGPGNRTLSIFDGFDRQTSVIDAVGNQTVTQYDPDGNVVRVSDFGPVGGASPTSNGPNPPAEPVSSLGTIQSGHLVDTNLLSSTETSYDELDRVVQSSDVLFVNTIPTSRTPDVAEGGSDVGLGDLTPGQTQLIPGVSGVTMLGRVSDRTEYDRDSRVTFAVDDDTSTTRTFYDGAGRVIETIDPQGNTVQSAYDADDNVIETRETDVSQVPGVPNEVFLTTNFYDSLNRLQQTVDNLGESTYYRYDSRGNLVAEADADGPASSTPIMRREFTGGSETVNTTNLFGNVTIYYYDGLDRQVREEQILTTTGQGDGIHIGASIFGVKDTPTAPESFTPMPDPTQGGGDGIIRTGDNYDEDSLLSSTIDDNGNVTVYLYDDLNRTIVESRGLVVGSSYTASNILGSRVVPTPTASTIDNPATIPDSQINAQLAETQSLVAGVAGLFPTLASRVDPPSTTIYGYDPNNNLVYEQDANGSETYTKYDAIGRAIAVRIFRAGQNDSFAGDPIFAPVPLPPTPTGTTVVTGTTVENFQYDGLSRMTYAFDNNDPTSTNVNSTVTDAYDSLGRIIEESQAIGGATPSVIDSAWRGDDLRSSLTYPNGRVEVYTYDSLDRLKSVSDQGASMPIATYNYIGEARVLEIDYPQNGTRETYLDNSGTVDVGYDGMQRPIEIRDLRSDNSLIVGFTYTYDRMGNKLTEGKLYDSADSETYTYDSAYRLLSFERGAGGIAPSQSTWTLDGVGNQIAVGSETRTYSSTNELIESSSGGPTTNYLYDGNGNQTDDGAYLYTYDALNRLSSVTLKSTSQTIAVYSYDALGRRIQKVVTNSGAENGTTHYLLDGMRDIEEHNVSGTLTQQYVFGAGTDQPLVLDRNLLGGSIATGPGNQRLFYETNALGSVYALTDTSGRIVEGYLYDAYGGQTVYTPGGSGFVTFGPGDVIASGGSSAVGNTYLFAGMMLDPETGLYYDGTRYLNTIQDRYLQRNPISDIVPGSNLYAYDPDRTHPGDGPDGR